MKPTENSQRVQKTFTQLCLQSCRKLLAQIGRVKSTILSEFGATLGAHERVLRLALNEAEAIAWQTGFPQLFFPTLAAEKAQAVAEWHRRSEALQSGNLAARDSRRLTRHQVTLARVAVGAVQ